MRASLDVRYFLTFACYGQWIHGAETGSVDKNNNQVKRPLLKEDAVRLTNERRLMRCPPYLLDEKRRLCVLDAIRERCAHADWNLLAAHVRSNHVHLVVEADIRPELVMNSVKSYASRELNRLGLDDSDQKRWARHGSTRWLWKDADVRSAIQYVVERQGEPMAVFLREGW